MITTRQIRIGLTQPPTGHEVEARYRCIEARHEGVTYNPVQDRTYCMCGRVIRDGDRSRPVSPYERAEMSASRTDSVGRQAREFLAQAHGGVA